jgi:hypothetical protein
LVSLQYGFKLLGGQGEVEEDGERGMLSLVRNLEIEIFPLNLKALCSLSQKESRFKLLSTLNLTPQGPIHVEAHLDLLASSFFSFFSLLSLLRD